MKKSAKAIMAILLSGVLLLSGCSKHSDADYEALQAELEAAQTELSSVQTQLNEVNTELSSAKSSYDSLFSTWKDCSDRNSELLRENSELTREKISYANSKQMANYTMSFADGLVKAMYPENPNATFHYAYKADVFKDPAMAKVCLYILQCSEENELDYEYDLEEYTYALAFILEYLNAFSSTNSGN